MQKNPYPRGAVSSNMFYPSCPSGQRIKHYLLDCWSLIRKDAAYGVDRVSAKDYEENLTNNIRGLVQRLKGKRYHAKLIRRKWIPKGEGKLRPLGIPAVEDKLLQIAVTRILESIYEQDFLRCSYGYRPDIGVRDAIQKLTVKLQFGKYAYVEEADIKGFFDNLDHNWMIKMLEKRVDDGPFLHLIKKWMKAGVLEENGEVKYPQRGTPQGGNISSMLSNIYLHYVLDVWFHGVVKKRSTGEACLIRYADDFVCGFEKEEDVERFEVLLAERMKTFGLELSAEKTRTIAFDRDHPESSFDFLGFEFRWGRDRKGFPRVQRQTARKKLRQSIARMKEWCQTNRNLPRRRFFEMLNAKLRGYVNHYGVIGNGRRISFFFYRTIQAVMKWLNRGNQRRCLTWKGLKDALKEFKVQQPKITEQRRINGVAHAV